MARPIPTTILELYDDDTDNMLQVDETDGVFCLFYKGKPFSLVQNVQFESTPKPIRKYLKVSWTKSGHAFRAARKWNNMFNCRDFTVVKVTEVKQLSDSYYGMK